MKSQVQRILAGATMIMATMLEPVSCQAGLFDWLIPGRSAVYYPNYYNAYGGAYNPYYSSGYSPYAAYGTAWTANPTTVFTPVTTPTATLMQPYSTYTYQAQRVPYYALQPTVPWSAVPSCGATAPYTAGYPAVQLPAAQIPAVSSWQTLGSANYASPAVSIPAAVPLPTNSGCSSYFPSNTLAAPSVSPNIGYGSAADFAPSLNASPTITNYPSSSYYGAPAAPTTTLSPSCPTCAGGMTYQSQYLAPSSSGYSGEYSATPWEPVATSAPSESSIPGGSNWQSAPASEGSLPADNRPQIDPAINMNSTGMRPTSYVPNTRPDAWQQPGAVPTPSSQTAGFGGGVNPTSPANYDYRAAPNNNLPNTYPPISDGRGLAPSTNHPTTNAIPGWPQSLPATPSVRPDDSLQTASSGTRPWEAIPIQWPSVTDRIRDQATDRTDVYRPQSISAEEGNWRQVGR
jgi:hypothetical protein